MKLTEEQINYFFPSIEEISNEFPIYGGDDHMNYQRGMRDGAEWAISIIQKRIENYNKLKDLIKNIRNE